MKIVTIVGARPQFIKAAVLSRLIRERGDVQEVLVHTGQHFDDNMSDIFFREMEIPQPDYNLEINSLNHGAMTGKMLEAIEKVLIKEKPDFVLVYGDTNSTLAGALAAKKLHIKIAHVEAGLRSFNYKMPEEINRILTDRIADILFCPTDDAVANLHREGFENFPFRIVRCGDIMLDASLYYSEMAAKKSTIIHDLKLKDFVLCSIHRAENTGDKSHLASILRAINHVHQQIPVLIPIHPGTRKAMQKYHLKTDAMLIDPVGYFDMIQLLRNCKMVITDSGGLQKEAFFFHKCSVTMREETEWTELEKNKFTIVTGSDEQKIISAFDSMRHHTPDFNINLYGDGQAGETILEQLLSN